MKKVTQRFLMLFVALLVSAASFAQPTELFFSEYVEGSSNNKALEIYNGTNAPIVLRTGGVDNYFMIKISNQDGTKNWTDGDITLFEDGHTVSSGDVFVVYNSSSDAGIVSVGDFANNGITGFNGNDPVALVKDVNNNGTYEDGTDVIVDAIGDMTAGMWGENTTFVKKSTIDAGNSTFTLAEWDESPQNTWTNLGTHTCDSYVTPSTCEAPTDFVTSNETDSTVVLMWTSTATLWNIEYGEVGFTQGTGTTVSGVNANPYVLNGLTAETDYDVYIQTDCGTKDVSNWSDVITFTTEASPTPPVTFPYFEDFNGVTTPDVPAGYLVENTNNDTREWITYESGSNTQMRIEYNGSLAMDDWFFTPAMPFDANETYQLKFTYKAQSSTYAEKLAVSLCTAQDGATATVELFSNDNIINIGYVTAVVDIPASTAGPLYLGFHGFSDVDQYFLFVDDILVRVLPTVPIFTAPTEVAFGETEMSVEKSETITISNNGIGTIDIAADAIGISGTDLAMFDWTTDATFPVSLAEDESFDITVKYLPTALVAHTASLDILANAKVNHAIALSGIGMDYTMTIPHTENFDAVEIPALPGGWRGLVSSTSDYAKVQTIATSGASSSPNVGRLYNYGDDAADLILVSNAIPTSKTVLNTLQVLFTAKGGAGSSIIVGTMSDCDDIATFSAFETVTLTTTMTNYAIDFTSYTGTDTRVAFKHGLGGTYREIIIDDVVFRLLPTTPIFGINPVSHDFGEVVIPSTASKDFVITNTGTDGLTITAASDVVISGANDTEFAITDDNTYPISLDNGATATYTVVYTPTSAGAKVASLDINTAAKGLHSAALTATAIDPTIIPEHLEDFEDGYPAGYWTESQGYLSSPNTTMTTTYSQWIEDGFGNVGTTGAARINIYGSTRREWAITPPINLGDGSTEYQLEFDLALTENSGTTAVTLNDDDKFAVVISTDNGITWSSDNVLQEWNSTTPISNTGDHVIIDLSTHTGSIMLGFYVESTVSGGDLNLYFDNFAINVAPDCQVPTQVIFSNWDATSVQVDFTSAATAWNYEVVATGEVPTGTGTATSDNPLTLNGFDPETTYDLYLQTDCGAGSTSTWAGPFVFTTTATCLVPTDLGATSAATSAELSWTSDAGTWNVQYGEAGFNTNTTGGVTGGTPIVGTTDNPYSLTSLAEMTNYDFYVQADCGNGDLSDWAGPFTFATTCNVPVISTFPWEENFDGVDAPTLPCGIAVTNDNGDTKEWKTIQGYPQSEPNAMEILYNGSLAMDDWFFTPKLVFEAGKTYKLSFSYRARTASFPEKLAVSLCTGQTAATATTELFNNDNIINTTYITETIMITPGVGSFYIGFHGYSDANMFAMYIDDLKIEEAVANDLSVIGIAPVFISNSDPVAPIVTIKNNGSATATGYTLTLISDEGYTGTASGTLPDILSGEEAEITFSDWTPTGVSTATLTATATITDDGNIDDNELAQDVTIFQSIEGIYEQHELASNHGAGVGGADLSELIAGQTSWGSGFQMTIPNSVADDFTVPAGETWTVDGFLFYGYQTGSPVSPSTFTDVIARVYDGDPASGGTVIQDLWTSGDVTLASSSWSGIYRVSNGVLDNTDRPIMRLVCEVTAFELTEGTYWIEWATGGSGTSGPWVPHLQFADGSTTTGNAQSNTSAGWAPITDIEPQGMPFDILGTTATGTSYSITFNVTDENSVAIEGADVTIGTTTLATTASGEVVFENLNAGTYDYTVEMNGYQSASSSVVVVDQNMVEDVTLNLTGINDIFAAQIKLFPNPSNGQFAIQGAENCKVEIYNAVGKMVSNKMLNSNNEFINMNNADGTYIVRIISGDKVAVKRINIVK